MSKKELIKAKVEKQDGGYLYPELGIHVVAKSEDSAKKLVKQYHGIDVDEAVTELAERAKAEEADKKEGS
jgi:hypothetical protein